jgi:hypothetical protein
MILTKQCVTLAVASLRAVAHRTAANRADCVVSSSITEREDVACQHILPQHLADQPPKSLNTQSAIGDTGLQEHSNGQLSQAILECLNRCSIAATMGRHPR